MAVEKMLNIMYQKLIRLRDGVEKKRLTYALEEMIYTVQDAGAKVDFNIKTNQFVILN